MSAPLEQAKYEAERACARFTVTLETVQTALVGTFRERLTPTALANHAWAEVREKGSEIADEAVEAVKARPLMATGAVAAFFVFLARGRIASAASRLWSGGDDAED